MEKIRSFLSLNINASIINSLATIQNRLKEALNEYNIKWEQPNNFHLTLRFLGGLYQDKLNELIKNLGFIKPEFKSIDMFTSGIGFFPDRKYPNIVFIDLTELNKNTDILVSNIDLILKRFDIIPDKKFVPHITIGRFRKENRKKLHDNFYTITEKVNISFDSFYLMKSTLTPKGSIYSVIWKFPFNKS